MSTNLSKKQKDFDWKEEDIVHKMEHLRFDLKGSSGGDKQNFQESRHQSIKRCIQSLVHACKCTDANCHLQSCHKLKHVVLHTKACCKKPNWGCPLCKQLIALCCQHAKHCHDTKCQVPYCLQIKQKVYQLQLLHRQQAQLMRHRIATRQRGQNPMQAVSTTASPVPSPLLAGGVKGSGGPPSGVMQAVLEAQEAAQRQAGSLDKPQPGSTVPPQKVNHQVMSIGEQSAAMPQQSPQPPQQMPQPSARIIVGPASHQLNFPISQPGIEQMRPLRQDPVQMQQLHSANSLQMAMPNMQQNQTFSQQQLMMWQQQSFRLQQQQGQQGLNVDRLLTVMELMEIDDENE